MPAKIVFTSDQIAELKQMMADGVTQYEVAAHFNTTDSMIRKVCKDNGIDTVWMHNYTCTCCGAQFKATHKTALCPTCKATPLVCVVCGKEFPKKYFPYDQKTCSVECRAIYRVQSGISKQGAQKARQRKLEKYGTLDPAVIAKANNGGQLAPKICKLCGKEFIPDTPRQLYCKEKHYGPCPVCGEPVEIKDYNIGPQACSEKCRMARINATCLERYGNKDAVNSEHAKKLARQHSLERYGAEYYSQTEEFKERYKQTNLEKYGVEYPLQSAEILEKSRATSLKKYGTSSPMQNQEVKDKVRATTVERYGGVGPASPEIRSKITATNREKYGCDWGFSNYEIQRKAIRTIREKYSVDNYLSSRENMESRIVDPSKVDEYLAFKADPQGYVTSHFDCKPPIYALTKQLGVSDTPVYDILIKNNCKDIIDRTKVSTMEFEMHNFLLTLVPESEIRVNDRKAIKPRELDFYLPNYQFAIECNPTLTHNSTMNSWDDSGDVLPYNYHQLKSKAAASAGIFLIHVFGYEWEHKRDILQSMICNAIGRSRSRIYGRNTAVVEVSSKDSDAFLDANHRQGRCNSHIRLGLVHKETGQLLSLMTFGKTRSGIGKHEDDDEDTFELVRFCSLLNTTVVGGASKLFSHFVHQYSPRKVVSFSDVAHTKGTLYSLLGFREVSRSDPGYCWVKPYGEVYRSRVACQKHNLPRLFDDVTDAEIQMKSERQIMVEHGYVQVFDSGVIRWEWTPESLYENDKEV